MITKNWYISFCSDFNNAPSSAVPYLTKVDGTTKKVSGSSNNMKGKAFGSVTKINVSTNPGSDGITFGDGSVPPTVNDYWLSGNVVSTVSMLTYVDDTVVSGDKYTVKKTFVLKNTGSADVTIREACWVANVAGYMFMMDRTLLDSPVTIPAGGQGVVTYSIAIELPIPTT